LGRKYNLFTADCGRDAMRLIEEEVPFEVIVSDFAMPGMNGAEFLERVREQDKEVVTILLTGQANFDDLSEVVRRGEIFRLLGKPCSPEVLAMNLEHALKQFRLIHSEKELLEQTLNGTISALSTLLAASRPQIYSRAERVSELSKAIARQMKLPGGWRLNIAAKFCFLGYLSLPDEFQEKACLGQSLPEDIQEKVEKLPQFVSGLLKDIPRMGRIRRIIELINSDHPHSSSENEEYELASIIRLARDFDLLKEQGVSSGEIFERLHMREQDYLSGSIDAMASSCGLDG